MLAGRALERELTVWSRVWRGDVFSSFVLPVLFLGAMGIGLGGLVDEASGDVDGLSYLEFLSPGLLVVSGLMMATGYGLWNVMAGHKWLGYYAAMVATEMEPRDAIVGQALFVGVRNAVASVCFLVVAAALGGVRSWWAPVAIVPSVLVAMLFFLAAAAHSSARDSDSSFPVIMRLGVQPVFLLSGTFFPVENLPDPATALAWLLPTWHAAEAARMATTGRLDPLFAVHLAVLVAGVCATVPIAARSLTRRLRP